MLGAGGQFEPKHRFVGLLVLTMESLAMNSARDRALQPAT
jgi:hypothetical protein